MNYKIIVSLIFVPLSLGLNYFFDGSTLAFLSSAVAIIPLAMLVTHYTGQLADSVGQSWGGLINVTFGNTTELIISLFAISKGLLDVVKAAITGSILMNLLLILGLSFFVGGLKYRSQKFDKLVAITNSAMLMLAVIAMLIPAIFFFTSANILLDVLNILSIGVAVVLLITYFASLYFTMVIHEAEKKAANDAVTNKKSNNFSWQEVIMLFLVTTFVAIEANILVGSIEEISVEMNISQVFLGIIVLPIISNVAESYTAIRMARNNKIDMSINIAVGSSTQIALFLVPILILLSHIIGNPMNVLFSILEITSIFVSVLAINIIYLQGKSNWLEGVQLCAAYLIIALAFYFA